MSPMSIHRFISNLSLPSGTSRRFDCPSCGGHGTLSVTNHYGDLKWQCFKASCGVRGSEAVSRTANDLKNQLLASGERDTFLFTMPEHFTSILSEEAAIEYLRRNNSLEAYTSGRVDMRFDPRQRRVVFLVKSEGRIIDAAGRALDSSVKPKWFRYGSSRYPFICGEHDKAALVEDGASACAVSSVVTGIALLGTSLQDSFLAPLKRYSKVYVCLDKDASKKSVAMHRILSYYTDVEVRLLEDDLKYLSPQQVGEVLKIQ